MTLSRYDASAMVFPEIRGRGSLPVMYTGVGGGSRRDESIGKQIFEYEPQKMQVPYRLREKAGPQRVAEVLTQAIMDQVHGQNRAGTEQEIQTTLVLALVAYLQSRHERNFKVETTFVVNLDPNPRQGIQIRSRDIMINDTALTADTDGLDGNQAPHESKRPRSERRRFEAYDRLDERARNAAQEIEIGETGKHVARVVEQLAEQNRPQATTLAGKLDVLRYDRMVSYSGTKHQVEMAIAADAAVRTQQQVSKWQAELKSLVNDELVESNQPKSRLVQFASRIMGRQADMAEMTVNKRTVEMGGLDFVGMLLAMVETHADLKQHLQHGGSLTGFFANKDVMAYVPADFSTKNAFDPRGMFSKDRFQQNLRNFNFGVSSVMGTSRSVSFSGRKIGIETVSTQLAVATNLDRNKAAEAHDAFERDPNAAAAKMIDKIIERKLQPAIHDLRAGLDNAEQLPRLIIAYNTALTDIMNGMSDKLQGANLNVDKMVRARAEAVMLTMLRHAVTDNKKDSQPEDLVAKVAAIAQRVVSSDGVKQVMEFVKSEKWLRGSNLVMSGSFALGAVGGVVSGARAVASIGTAGNAGGVEAMQIEQMAFAGRLDERFGALDHNDGTTPLKLAQLVAEAQIMGIEDKASFFGNLLINQLRRGDSAVDQAKAIVAARDLIAEAMPAAQDNVSEAKKRMNSSILQNVLIKAGITGIATAASRTVGSLVMNTPLVQGIRTEIAMGANFVAGKVVAGAEHLIATAQASTSTHPSGTVVVEQSVAQHATITDTAISDLASRARSSSGGKLNSPIKVDHFEQAGQQPPDKIFSYIEINTTASGDATLTIRDVITKLLDESTPDLPKLNLRIAQLDELTNMLVRLATDQKITVNAGDKVGLSIANDAVTVGNDGHVIVDFAKVTVMVKHTNGTGINDTQLSQAIADNSLRVQITSGNKSSLQTFESTAHPGDSFWSESSNIAKDLVKNIPEFKDMNVNTLTAALTTQFQRVEGNVYPGDKFVLDPTCIHIYPNGNIELQFGALTISHNDIGDPSRSLNSSNDPIILNSNLVEVTGVSVKADVGRGVEPLVVAAPAATKSVDISAVAANHPAILEKAAATAVLSNLPKGQTAPGTFTANHASTPETIAQASAGDRQDWAYMAELFRAAAGVKAPGMIEAIANGNFKKLEMIAGKQFYAVDTNGNGRFDDAGDTKFSFETLTVGEFSKHYPGFEIPRHGMMANNATYDQAGGLSVSDANWKEGDVITVLAKVGQNGKVETVLEIAANKCANAGQFVENEKVAFFKLMESPVTHKPVDMGYNHHLGEAILKGGYAGQTVASLDVNGGRLSGIPDRTTVPPEFIDSGTGNIKDGATLLLREDANNPSFGMPTALGAGREFSPVRDGARWQFQLVWKADKAAWYIQDPKTLQSVAPFESIVNHPSTPVGGSSPVIRPPGDGQLPPPDIRPPGDGQPPPAPVIRSAGDGQRPNG